MRIAESKERDECGQNHKKDDLSDFHIYSFIKALQARATEEATFISDKMRSEAYILLLKRLWGFNSAGFVDL